MDFMILVDKIKVGAINIAKKLSAFIRNFWNKVLTTMKMVVTKLEHVVKGVLKGMKVFIRKVSDKIFEMTKSYSYDAEADMWHETIVKKQLNEDEVPDEMKERFEKSDEFECTEELNELIA